VLMLGHGLLRAYRAWAPDDRAPAGPEGPALPAAPAARVGRVPSDPAPEPRPFVPQKARARQMLRVYAAAGVLAAAFVWSYFSVIVELVRDWSTDENFSHGFLIAPLALYFVWKRRSELRGLPVRPSAVGLLVIAASLALLVAGRLGVERFVTRISMLGVVGGTVVFLLGWDYLRVVRFPLAFLILMIPWPALIFNQIAFPLQIIASRLGEVLIRLWGIPVLREGNLITLANTQLEVAEACSGIRSLVSLVTLAVVYGYFKNDRTLVRVLLALAMIPIAVVVNGIRVAGTGVASHYYGAEVATAFFHTFSGWLLFVLATVLLTGVERAASRLLSDRRRARPRAAAGRG